MFAEHALFKSIPVAIVMVMMAMVPAARSHAIPVNYSRIIQTGDLVPGTSDPITSFAGQAPSIGAARDVAFVAYAVSTSYDYLVVRDNSTLLTLYDANTTGSGAGGDVHYTINKPALDGSQVIFNGDLFAGHVYVSTGNHYNGSPYQVSFPQVVGPASHPEIHRGDTTFIDEQALTGTVGVRLNLNVLADTLTAIPNGQTGETFFNFGDHTSVRKGTVAFTGRGSQNQAGIYTSTANGPIHVVADTSTILPGLSGTFNNAYGFRSPDYSGANTVFAYEDTNNLPVVRGLYMDVPGSGIRTIADIQTSIPGANRMFHSFGRYSIAGQQVAFSADDTNNRKGLYAYYCGQLERLIEVNDKLDGKYIDDLLIGYEAMWGNRIVFRAEFTDGSEGIYQANLPYCPVTITEMDAVAVSPFFEIGGGMHGFPSPGDDPVVAVVYDGVTDQVAAVYPVSQADDMDGDGLILVSSADLNPDIMLTDDLPTTGGAIVLYQGTAADFPIGQSPTTENMIGGVAYGTGPTTDTDLLDALGLYDEFKEDAQGDPMQYSIGLWPADYGDYRPLQNPTPGTANVPEPASLCLLVLGMMFRRRR